MSDLAPIPITFSGVAAWRRQGLGRLLLLALVVGALISACVMWTVGTAGNSLVTQSLRHLPAKAEISNGKLYWPGDPTQALAENDMLAAYVNLGGAETLGQAADFQFELTRDTINVSSLFGYLSIPYPRDVVVSLNAVDAGAWWNAWQPVVLGAIGAVVLLALAVAWVLIATLHALPALWLALVLDLDTDSGGSWKMAAVSFLPSGVIIAGLIVAYGHGKISLVALLAAIPCTLIVGWIYLLGALVVAPRAIASNQNPFAPPPEGNDE